jgi:hypothetical protein
MIFQRRDTASFLSSMPDRLPLSSLLLPGNYNLLLISLPFNNDLLATHDTYALHRECQRAIPFLTLIYSVWLSMAGQFPNVKRKR